MRTRAIGRRTGRAIFVLAVAVALGGGTAAAYAEVTWEFAPADAPGGKPQTTVVTEEPVETPSPSNDEPSWE
jgi:hypothetical protein